MIFGAADEPPAIDDPYESEYCEDSSCGHQRSAAANMPPKAA
jgi:hypothetical protein